MAEVCKSCNQKINSRSLKVKCSSCVKPFHASCEGLSKEDVEHVTGSDYVWRCKPCQTEHRRSMRLDQKVDNNTVTLEDIMARLESLHKEMTGLRKDQQEMEATLGKSLNECFARVDAAMAEIKEVRTVVEGQKKEMDKLSQENSQLKERVVQLEAQADNSEQYSRRNMVEVFGVPEVPNENVLQTVSQVSRSLGFNIEPSMVDACHRLTKNAKDPRPRGIIIKFVRRFDKEELLRKKRSKKNFTARDAGFADPSPVYLNESLTAARRKLMAAAREVRRQHGYRYLWTSNGRILMKKEDTGPVIVINDVKDLHKVH